MGKAGHPRLRDGLHRVSLRNHSLTEDPRLFYTHFCSEGDAIALAKALRTALNATAVHPPKRARASEG